MPHFLLMLAIGIPASLLIAAVFAACLAQDRKAVSRETIDFLERMP